MFMKIKSSPLPLPLLSPNSRRAERAHLKYAFGVTVKV